MADTSVNLNNVKISYRGKPTKEWNMGKLNAKKRNALPSKSFAGPDRSYPIEDKSHARNALSRVSQFGSSKLKAEVRSKVAKKYPSIKSLRKSGKISDRQADKHGLE